jgi:hypothetical protein
MNAAPLALNTYRASIPCLVGKADATKKQEAADLAVRGLTQQAKNSA